MSVNTKLTLFCLAVNEDLVPEGDIFVVKTDSNERIHELKERIIAAATTSLRNLPLANFFLWKLDDSFQLEAHPFGKLLSKLQQLHLNHESRTEANNKAQVLSITASVGEAFSSPPATGCVHVLVQFPRNIRRDPTESESNLSDRDIRVKRRKIDDDIPPFLIDYHRRFWGVSLDPELTTLPTQLKGDVLPGEPFCTFRERMLVRAEYIRAFDAVKLEATDETRLVVLTGQPGIGKTLWVEYALRRCLGEKQPVVWYRNQICFFFSESGVSVIDPLFHESNDKHTWCFVNSMDAPTTLPTAIYNRDVKLFPIYVTGPTESRWRKLHQRRIPSLIVMNPWTIEEIMKALTLYPDRVPDEVRERFYNAGPVPRYCLQFTPEDIRQFYYYREKEIHRIQTAGSFMALINDTVSLNMGDAWDSPCLIYRAPPNVADWHVVQPISLPVSHQLRSQLFCLEDRELSCLLERCSRIPAARGLAGVIFEAKFLRLFHNHIKLRAKPMLQSPNSRSNWHVVFEESTSTPQLQQAGSDVVLSIQPKDTLMYKEYEELNGITEEVYCIPQSPYEMAFDALIMHKGYLYLFQFATDTHCNIHPRLESILAQISGLPPRCNWVFIFIVPKDLPELTCPHSDDGFLKDHTPFTARMEQEHFSLNLAGTRLEWSGDSM